MPRILMSPASKHRLRETKNVIWDVFSSVPWWRQQLWVIVTEVLMGFLVGWAIVRHIPSVWIGLGLGIVYAVSCLSMWGFRKHARHAAILSVALSLGTLVLSSFVDQQSGFLGLCVAIGVLLAFRDSQSVSSMAWIPVRALRKGHSNTGSLLATSIASALLLAAALYVSGVISAHWKWLPHALVLLAFGFFVPRMVMRMQKAPRQLARPMPEGCVSEMTWLLRLGVVFNAVNFLGRRLIIPSMIVKLAQLHGASEQVLPTLGAVMGLIGVLSAFARAPMMLSGKMTAMSILRWGARLSLVGWALLCVGLLLWSFSAMLPAVVAIPVVFGWVLLELTNRTWSVAYMEQIRLSSVGPYQSSARAHRRALHQFMVRKSGGGAVGCLLGGLIAPSLAPAVALVFLAGCFVVLEKPPETLIE